MLTHYPAKWYFSLEAIIIISIGVLLSVAAVTVIIISMFIYQITKLCLLSLVFSWNSDRDTGLAWLGYGRMVVCRMMGSDIIWYPQPKMIASIANDMRLKAFKTNTDSHCATHTHIYIEWLLLRITNNNYRSFPWNM